MTDVAPHLTAGFWRTRRSAAIAGIIFGVLLLAAMIMLRIALSEGSLQTLQADTQRRTLIRISLGLVPFAGIAFLWFIGVVREQLGAVEDRLFSTVFMGSGLLFLAMLFTGAAISASLIAMLARANANADVFAYGRDTAQGLFSVYAMRMAAVFTLSVSTVGLRTSALPRWVSYLGYWFFRWQPPSSVGHNSCFQAGFCWSAWRFSSSGSPALATHSRSISTQTHRPSIR
jgi:hypothetical protein